MKTPTSFSSRECGHNASLHRGKCLMTLSTNRKPVAVVKVGGDMVLDKNDRRGLANNVKDLIAADWQCVILHGGGPQLNRLQKLHGLVPNKIDGRRITAEADLLVVKQALCGEVNVDLVSALLAAGLPAFGCHGASGTLIEAEKRPPVDFATHGVIDFGEVGDVVSINVSALECLLKADFIPVIASLGTNKGGRIFNINADTTVAAIASALNADLLILSTKVGGIFRRLDDPDSRIATVTPNSAEALIDQGVITDGMIPKVQEALALLDRGVASIAIANASQVGGFLDIANGDGRIGTRLIAD